MHTASLSALWFVGNAQLRVAGIVEFVIGAVIATLFTVRTSAPGRRSAAPFRRRVRRNGDRNAPRGRGDERRVRRELMHSHPQLAPRNSQPRANPATVLVQRSSPTSANPV